MKVKCNAENCTHNKNGECTAEAIEIYEYDLGMATNSCDTFRGKNTNDNLLPF